jgi:hypothetical protein
MPLRVRLGEKGNLNRIELTSKDIQEDGRHFLIGEQELKRLLNRIWRSSTVPILTAESPEIDCVYLTLRRRGN